MAGCGIGLYIIVFICMQGRVTVLDKFSVLVGEIAYWKGMGCTPTNRECLAMKGNGVESSL